MISYTNERALKDPREEQELFDRRAWTGRLIISICMLGLLSRYLWLQVFSFEDFSTRSENNRVSVRPVVPNRGLIYDRRGRGIADNLPAYRLEITPEKVAGKGAGLETLL